ncbi:probable alpha-mannosidase At5g66150 [Olea europaea var. sylvestris]|uniref:probable alpha-mannosidase At5g66150 n=1 Tax=Olea europaea var. sylvestris TaxID=158386 RepID=UPI000C1CD6C0|nr:probable alpha-mannosidase At5g66150 [Olea europaea var. sylvestris]
METLAHSFTVLLCIVSVLCSYEVIGVDGYIKYNTRSGIVDGKLNVHLVPHSHDDVGWLKTIDQYYVGSNNSIQGACVENVLDSVVMSLSLNPNRKFIFAEMVAILCSMFYFFGIKSINI